MKLTFIGCGSAFAPQKQYQTNALIEKDGKRLLIDCGSDARFALKELGLGFKDIDAVYITHLHADHVGGMEWLGFCTYFTPSCERPVLYAVYEVMDGLWNTTLKGGMESLEGQIAHLTTYFECAVLGPNEPFIWQGIGFQPVQTVHVMSGFKIVYSYGLMIDLAADKPSFVFTPGKIRRIFYTGDTQFCPRQIERFYSQAGVIFHDCETSPFHSNVHAHYEDLRELPEAAKKKMWLMHYQAGRVGTEQWHGDGFAGMVKKGQSFEFGAEPGEAGV